MSTIVIPDPLPSPIEDCKTLRKAFIGWGTDEKSVIKVLGHRRASDRLKICLAYEQLYSETLISSLEAELSGDFLRAIRLWTWDPPERDAKLAKEALTKQKLEELLVIVEISCASSPQHLIAVRKAYCDLFKCSMEEDIVLHAPASLANLLVNLVSAYRYEGNVVDEERVHTDGRKLHEAVRKGSLDENDNVWIMSTRNIYQLRRTFKFYLENYGKPFEQDIKESLPTNFGSIFEAVVKCINSPQKYFAQAIQAAIVGLGTDEDSLTRAIVIRAEIDMENIKYEYQKMYKVSLVDDVIGDTSGDYKDFLVTLIGGATF